MKFTCSVEIDLPRAKVVELFANSDNLQHWQSGLVSFEHLGGIPGQPGATAKMHFKDGKHEFDLLETVRVNNLPDEFTGEYETKRICWNSMKSSFTSITEDKTRFDSEIEYKFIGFSVKLFALFMPWIFRKQVQKYLNNFKDFCETGASVRK